MSKKPKSPYFDYCEEPDTLDQIQFNVDSEVIIDSQASIQIIFTAKKEYPRRTMFRFIIPYGWEPIDLKSGIISIKSTVKGRIKSAKSQIMVLYQINELLEIGGSVEFNYNESKERFTSGDIAYIDPVYVALDYKLLKEKLFTRIGTKQVKMMAGKASFFLIKIPTIYQDKPADIHIVALDKNGNRDYGFNESVRLKGDNCLNFPEYAQMEKGYAKLEQKLTFKKYMGEMTKVETLMRENLGFGDFPTAQELLSNIGRLTVQFEGLYGESNPIVWDKDFSTQVYWGDTHIHTREFSDGIGTGRDGFNYAKNNIFHDFAALGDHINQRTNTWMEGRTMYPYSYTNEVWQELIELCKEFTDDSFVAIPGYEWSGRVLYAKAVLNLDCPYELVSDKVVLFPLEFAEKAPLIDYISKEGCFQHQLYNQLKGIECAIISHTTQSCPMGTSWNEVDNEVEKVVEIYSSHGSSEEFGGGYRTLMTNRKEGSVKFALSNGFKLGFIGGGDDHYSHPGCSIKQDKMKNFAPTLRYRPGIAAIFSDKLTSRDLIKNLNNRNCYGTTGERMWIKLKINSTLMGQETEVNEPPTIIITVCGTGRVDNVELIKNGETVAIRTPANDRIKFAFKDNDLKSGEEAYYYVRVTQFDGERGWSSPIWVKAHYSGT